MSVGVIGVNVAWLLLGMATATTQARSRTLTLSATWDGRDTLVEVYWLQDASLSLATQQHLALRDTLTMSVPTRMAVVRLHPKDASPVSFVLSAGTASTALKVPALATGGEVFGVLQRREFLPEALDLTSASGQRRVVPDGRGVFSAGGLIPGEYTLAPRYRGGVLGIQQTLVVRRGETSELLPLPLPETGAVSIEVAADACARAPRLTLSDAASRPVVVQQIHRSQCRQEIEGLAQGAYEASLSQEVEVGGTRVLTQARFDVANGRRAAVSLAPVVSVFGQARLGQGHAMAGITVEFGSGGRRWQTQTDENGDYALTLERPGEYGISVGHVPGVPDIVFSRTLTLGRQRADLELGEAAVYVRVTAEDGGASAGAVEVALNASNGRRIEGSWPFKEGTVARFVGITYDEYRVTATTASGLSSQHVAVARVAADSPFAEVELVLGSHAGSVRVVDASNRPLAGARGQTAAIPLKEVSAGVFSLAGVALGEALRVQAPGYVPRCHTLQDGDLPDLSLVLEPVTDHITLHIEASVNWESATITGLPDADCAIGIDAFDLQARAARDEATVVLGLAAGSFALVVDGRTFPIVVPGGDVRVALTQ
jgi:hypothetical protein